MSKISLKFKNIIGFTLVEIIAVLIILGILAAIALPNLFSWVHKSQGASAIVEMGSYKSQVEACLMAHVGSETACAVAVVDNGFNINTNNLVNGSGGGNYVIQACGNGCMSGNDYIYLTKNPDGSFTCSGIGIYAGIC